MAVPLAWSAEELPSISALRAQADSGDPLAMSALADAYANGEGVAQDYPAALRYYTQAAARGHPAALSSIAQLAEAGRGMPIDHFGAFRFYLKAAEQGWVPAQLKVGEMLAVGLGATRDEAAAVNWYRKAALNGNAEAQYKLANAYEQGSGVAKDRIQARKWYRDAADRGHAGAQFNLALMLEGGLGSATDVAAAAELYRKAAEQGFAPAQNNYGLLLAEGRGSVAANLVESYAWLSLAVENGTNAAGRNLVAQKLNPAQLAAANERITALRNGLVASAVVVSPVQSAPVSPAEKLVVAAPASAVLPASPVERAPVASSKGDPSSSPTAGPRFDANELARIESQLTAATKELSALKAEQDSVYTSSARIVADLSELLSSAAEAVKVRGMLAAAEQKVRDSTRSVSGAAGNAESPAISATGEQERRQALLEANKQVDDLRVRAANALTKWSDRVARLSSEFDQVRASDGRPQLTQSLVTVEAAPAAQPLAVSSEERSLRAEVATLSQRSKELSAQNDKLQKDRDRLAQENTKLGADLRVAAETIAASSKTPVPPADWMKERETLLRQQQEASARLAAADKRLAELAQAEKTARDAAAQNATAKVGNTELTAQLTELKTAGETLRIEHARLSAENAKLLDEKRTASEAAFTAEKSRTEAWASEREALRLKTKELTAEVTNAEQRMKEMTKIAESERTEALAAKKLAESAGRQLAEAAVQAARAAELAGAVEKLTQQNAELQKKLAGFSDDQSKRTKLEESLAAAEKRARELATASAQLAAAKADFAALEAENARLTSNAQAVKADRTKEVARLQEENLTLGRRVTGMQDVATRLAEAERRGVQINRDGAAAREEAIAAKTEADKIKQQLATATRDASRAQELASSVENLTRENAALQKKQSELLSEKGQKTNLEKSLAAAEQRSRELESTGAQLKTAQADLETLKAENSRLTSSAQAQEAERKKEVARLQEANTTLENRLKGTQDLTARLAAVENREKRIKQDGNVAQEQLLAARKDQDKLKAQLALAAVRNDRVDELNTAVERLTRENTSLIQRTQAMDTLRIENTRLAGMEKTLAAAEQRRSGLETAAAQLAIAQRDLANARSETARLSSSTQAEALDRTNQIAQLQQENATTLLRLREAQGALDQIATTTRLGNGNINRPVVASRTASVAVPAPSNPLRVYTVASGDSLTRISVRYYGTGNRWQEIYNANREALRTQTALRVGQQLRIP